MSGELVFDLNALFIYAKVVEHGGFAPAGRVLGIPKSTISRKVAQLEARLGVRLVQRSTRQFQVTEIGQAYYRHCVGDDGGSGGCRGTSSNRTARSRAEWSA
ncbi:LysR family transcriptional regulator [Pseudomonas aeruginosa]|nr:LysR family transcriptional regulator [Pseudomonas aeruginosa]